MNSPSFAAAAALSLAFALAGCAGKPKPVEVPAMPITADALEAMRASFTQADPNARLGAVAEVLPAEMYLTVTGVTATDFPVGTAVAVIDSARATIAYGEVVRTFADSVHVRYEAKGPRAPKVGDVAVRFG